MNFSEWEQKKAVVAAVRDWGYLGDFQIVVSRTDIWFNSEINRDFRDDIQFWSYRLEPSRKLVNETLGDSATWFDYEGRSLALKSLLNAIADDWTGNVVIDSRSLEATKIKPDRSRLSRYKKALGL